MVENVDFEYSIFIFIIDYVMQPIWDWLLVLYENFTLNTFLSLIQMAIILWSIQNVVLGGWKDNFAGW